MKVRSLRLKLGITNALLIAIAFALLGFYRFRTVNQHVQASFDQTLRADATLLATRISIALDGQVGFFRENLGAGELRRLRNIRAGSIITDAAGIVIQAGNLSEEMSDLVTSSRLAAVLVRQDGFLSVESEHGIGYRFISLPLPGIPGVPPLILHLGRTTEALDVLMEEYKAVYFFTLPITVMLSGIVGWFLADRAVRPFEALARAANRVTSLNLDEPISTRNQEHEVQRLVTAFNGMVGRLHNSFENLRRFNADLAHEFRTPLAILRGDTEMALGSPDVPEDLRALLASNMEELSRLSELVNQMLMLSEAEAGDQVLARKSLNLRPIIEDLVEQMRPLGEVRGIQIALENFPDAVISGDELWVRRALVNVLDNAIKYSRDDGRIEVSGQVADGLARIGIRDHGIGISGDDLPHVFNRLYRADPARTRASGGLGLGLSLVQWVVEAHDGKVRVLSELGLGTLCELEFPITPAHAASS
jgi:heavy metal sensor kinase